MFQTRLVRQSRSCQPIMTLLILFVAFSPSWAVADEPFEFPPATHNGGRLTKLGHVPVLILQGSPEEMGDQLGSLLRKPLTTIVGKQADLLHGFGLPALPGPVLLKIANLMVGQFPDDYLTEMKAASRASGVNLDFLVFGNVIYDVGKMGGCSALLVERDRSATGQILFGRNMDFPTFGFLDRCGLLVVYRPTGKHAFASVAFPGFFGCISGMNDAGLAVAQLEVNQARDGSARFNPAGTPLAFCFRRVLEECQTIDEAEKLLNRLNRTSMVNMAICDRKSVAVLEITTKNVVRRKPEEGYCACTNHFRSGELAEDKRCRRYAALSAAFARPKLGMNDVLQKLDEVHQGHMTIQAMVFEPETLRLHLALGEGPVTKRPLERIELSPLFTADPTPPATK